MNRKSIYYFSLFFFFLSGTIIPNAALGQSSTNLLDKMNQRLALDIPAPYSNKLRGFVSNSATLNLDVAANYTESFIIKQMATDQGISKSNQYLFIWDRIYAVLSNNELYDGNDGDEKRYEEYETAFDFVLSCEKEYKENLKEVLEREQQKAKEDAQKAKEDAQKAKEDAQKAKEEVMKSDTLLLNEIIRFYHLYKNAPNTLTADNIKEIKRIAKETIDNCKIDEIDYRKFFLQYLKEKEVNDLFRILEIE